MFYVKRLIILTSILFILHVQPVVADDLVTAFKNPPEESKPWCYWYWISDNLSREGITKDLEAMARVGIGEALVGNIFLDDVPAGNVKVFSDGWWSLVEHAIREGDRVGVNIGLFNCPGWSQSGGPWIKPEQAMRYLVSSEQRVEGPQRFVGKIPAAKEPFQDVAVIAFPAPAEDARVLLGKRAEGDGLRFVFESDQPFTARSLSLTPTKVPWKSSAFVRVIDSKGESRDLKTFSFDRSNMAVGVGPMPQGPVTISFSATTALRFEVLFPDAPASAALETAVLHAAARLDSYVEKQLGKMHPTPLPMWDDYKWSQPAEPDAPSLLVAAERIVNLNDRLSDDGTVSWDVPPGQWVIQRIGMTPTGTRNAPASPEAQGLEVDKMNRSLAAFHFDQFIGEALRRVPQDERAALTRVIADSYEMGSQNWTDGFEDTFQEAYGYDPIPWLAVLQGRIVSSADQSERFLWDLRRLVADRIATEYVGGLSELSRQHGLGLWLENYGHWGFPSEFLKYGSRSDRIGGEFWVTGSLGSIECRAASSCANTYGKKFVSAEAFTGGPPFQNTPADLKARGDWSFCEGINHFVLHVYIHQPWEDRQPGVNAWFGSEFNRHNTWFEQSAAWIDYVRRCSWMLQQGNRVADVAYFIGEDTPAMTGVRRPKLPAGFDFDFINAEVIENLLKVEDGLLKLPHGTTYRMLVLPPSTTMRPAVLKKIRDLVHDGATVVGSLPAQSPSMENYPSCDVDKDITRVPLQLGPLGSVLVVFREPADTDRVVSVIGDGQPLLSTIMTKTASAAGDSATAGSFTIAGWVKPNDARALDSKQIADLANIVSHPDNDPSRLAVDLSRGTDGQLKAVAWQSGDYVLQLASGQTKAFSVGLIPEPQPIVGPWSVAFDSLSSGPETFTFPTLSDWTDHQDPQVKHYSGTASYRNQFDLPSSIAGQRLWLDLGKVCDLATVRVNGKELGTLWNEPWRIEITSAARPGQNSLEIQVVNAWNNRLVGDANLPKDQQQTFLAKPTVKPNSPLLAAGLIGPVTIHVAREIKIEQDK